MTTSVATIEENDETPTKVSDNFPSATLMLAARVDRLAELALERLQVAPDDDALASACADLAQIRALAGAVTR
jgi:hypothetical protein